MYPGQGSMRHGHQHHGHGLERPDHSKPKVLPRNVERQRQEAKAQREKAVNEVQKDERPKVFEIIRSNNNSESNLIVQSLLGKCPIPGFNTQKGHGAPVEREPISPAQTSPVAPAPHSSLGSDAFHPPNKVPPLPSSHWQNPQSHPRSSSYPRQHAPPASSRQKNSRPSPSAAVPHVPGTAESFHSAASDKARRAFVPPPPVNGFAPQPPTFPVPVAPSSRSRHGNLSSSSLGGEPERPVLQTSLKDAIKEVNSLKPKRFSLGILQTPRPDRNSSFEFSDSVSSSGDFDHPTSTIHDEDDADGPTDISLGRTSDTKIRQHHRESNPMIEHGKEKEILESRLADVQSSNLQTISSSSNPDKSLDDDGKSTDESSDEEDTSGASDSEESSSSGEEAATQETQSDPSPLINRVRSLKDIFQTNKATKDESPPQDISNSNERNSPKSNNDSIPSMPNRGRRAAESRNASHSSRIHSEEDISETQPKGHPKISKQGSNSVNASSHHPRKEKFSSRYKSAPNISSDSDDDIEEPRPKKRETQKKESLYDRKRNGGSMVKEPTQELLPKRSSRKKEEVVKSESNSRPSLMSDMLSDIDSDCSIDIVNTSPEKGNRRNPHDNSKKSLAEESVSMYKSPKEFVSPLPTHVPSNNNYSNISSKRSHKGPVSSASQITNPHRTKVSEDRKHRGSSIPKAEDVKKERTSRDRKVREPSKAKRNKNGANNDSLLDIESVDSNLLRPDKQIICEVPINKEVQYKDGVPQILCSIPLRLIDKIPPRFQKQNQKAPVKEKDLFKEVLELRTSKKHGASGSVKDRNNIDARSPTNEDNAKKRAICSIYGKRQSPFEPDKIKKENNVTAAESEDKIQADTRTKQLDAKEVPTIKNDVNGAPTVTNYSSKYKKERRKDKVKKEEPIKMEKEDSAKVPPPLSLPCKRAKEENHDRAPRPVKKLKSSPKEVRSRTASPRDSAHESPADREFTAPLSHLNGERSTTVSSNSLPCPPAAPPVSAKRTPQQSSSQKSGKCSPALRSREEASVNPPNPSTHSSRTKNVPSTSPSVNSTPSVTPESHSQATDAPTSNNTAGGHGQFTARPYSMMAAGSHFYHGGLVVPPSMVPNGSCFLMTDPKDYMDIGTKKKHSADSEENIPMRVVLYLEAALYFILSGVCSPKNYYDSYYTLYEGTDKLIKHVAELFQRGTIREEEEIVYIKLRILILRCRSLLNSQLHLLKRVESKTAESTLNEYVKKYHEEQAEMKCANGSTHNRSVGGTTPAGDPSWGNAHHHHPRNSSPSLSPTPSPAESVESNGSQSSSGYSTSTPPRNQTVSVPTEILNMFIKHYESTRITTAYDMWREANIHICSNELIKEFFITLDNRYGSLNLHSSLHDLVYYMEKALMELRKELCGGNSSSS